MKTTLFPMTTRKSFANPFRFEVLPFFCVLAFLPCFLRLSPFAIPITTPLAMLGPILGGFWLVASIREIRLNFVLFGSVFGTVLWIINWLMLAGKGCCGTFN